MIQKFPFSLLVISGVSTILWHLSESLCFKDFQEIKPKYLKINSMASKNQPNFCVSYLFLSFASPVFSTGKLCIKIQFFWYDSSELHSTESTPILFNVFVLFNHLQPRNCSHLASFCYVLPDPEQSQGNTWRSFNDFGRNSFHLYTARNIRELIHVMNMNQSYGKYCSSRIPLQRCWK